MSHHLPPLSALRIFEAAGRKRSFKLAAEEIGITPSAVSHSIQTLEDRLGSALFHRSRKGIALTPEGKHYLPAVAEALKLLTCAPERTRHGHVRMLHISVTPTFGLRLLLPRLHRFRALHPDIDVVIDTTHTFVELARDSADLAIRLGNGDWEDVIAEKLLTETLVPVCSPQLVKRLGPVPSLADAPIIHITTLRQGWQAWTRATGRGPVDCERGLKVDNAHMAIEAAVAGLGIAMGRRPMVDAELEQGTLVRFDTEEVASETSYWLVMPQPSGMRPDLQAFRNWLTEELQCFRAQHHATGGGAACARSSAPTA
jgi:DNA-binding transcriptional LysR family regulator